MGVGQPAPVPGCVGNPQEVLAYLDTVSILISARVHSRKVVGFRSNRGLLVDGCPIDSLKGVRLKLHHPGPADRFACAS